MALQNPLQNVDKLLNFLGLGKTAGNVNLATMAPTLGRASNQANQQVTSNQSKQRQLLQMAKTTKDPNEKRRLLQQSRDLDANTAMSGNAVGDLADLTKQRGNVSDADLLMSNLGFATKRGAQQSAELASYAVPFGKAAQGAGLASRVATKALLPGAVSAGLQGLAKDDATVQSVGQEALGGALGAGLLHGAGKLAQKATGGISDRLMNSVFKEPLKATRSAIKTGEETLGEQAIKKGFKGMTNEGIYKNSVGAIDTLENKLQEKLKQSTEKIPLNDIKSGVSKLIKKYTDSGNISAVNNITGRLAELEKVHGEAIPVSTANQIKRTLYEEARNAYGQTSSEAMEGVKGIARALKEGVAKKVSGVDKINEALSLNGRMADSMVDKMARGGRNNLLGLTQGVLAGGGIAGAGATGGLSLLPALLQGALGSTPGKIATATTLKGANTLINKAGESPLLQQALGQTASRVGGAVMSPSVVANPPIEQPNQQQNTDQNIDQQVAPPSEQSNADILAQMKQFNVPEKNMQEFMAFAQQQGVQLPSQQPATQGMTVTPEMMDMATLTLAPKELAKLEKIYARQQGIIKDQEKAKGGGSKSSASLAVEGKAKTGLQAISSMETLLTDNPSLLNRTGVPMISLLKGQDRKQYDAAVSSFADALGGLRTGASVSPEQQEFYKNMLPKPGDDTKTILKKFQDLKDELNIYAQTNITDGQSAISEEEQALQMLSQMGINLQ